MDIDIDFMNIILYKIVRLFKILNEMIILNDSISLYTIRFI
jgi:hypothetical protein